ncbi:hypothetical protein [Yersinia ruckeri]|uniref:hypothetical protein n=1 Tax=Yersinia ruckeri TaxID=29486 RepID=UPI0020BE6237|nr:hypothetical protein [Yersinia ruckeri]MCW6527646.1 hypothetical protein [Yersinia ruckeri]MCW6561982.1 hypothetical protein [Yersinia ruckeri]UZY04226.1 hypothetical protein LNQ41_013635 [Yersinia ruckeri]
MIITAATLRNIVKFDTDIQSLKRIKEEMKKLKKESSGLGLGTITPAQSKANIKAIEAHAKKQAAAINKILHQQGVGAGSGTGTLGNPNANWQAILAAQQAAMNRQAIADREEARAKARITQEERKRLAIKRRAAESAKREINAIMKVRDIAFNISKLESLSLADKAKAVMQAKQLANQYRRGEIDLREMNQQMRFLQTNTRKAAAEAARLRRQQAGASGRHGVGSIGAIGVAGMASTGLMAGAGSAYLAYSSATNSVERANQIRKGIQAGADSYEYQALQRLIQGKGIDVNLESVFQDLQEKLGEVLSQAEFDVKTKKYKGGGELTEVINDLFLPLGQNLQDVAKMTSGEFIVNMVDNGKALKKTASEMRFYTETVSDLSRVSGLFADDGKQVIKTLRDMQAKGHMLSDEQLESLTRLRAWGLAVSNASQTLSDKFSISLSNAMGGTDGLAEAMRQLTPLVEGLGKVIAHIIKLTGFSVNQLAEPKTQNELVQSVKEPEKRLNSNSSIIMGLSAWELLKNQFKDSKPAFAVPTPQAMLSPTPYQPSSQYSAPKQTINVMPTPVQLNIDGAELKNVFSLIADNKITNYNDNILNDINSSYLNK